MAAKSKKEEKYFGRKEEGLGIDDGNTPVGAFVTYTGKEPDNGPGEALVIKKMYLSKEYDSIGVMNSTVALILGYAEEKKLAGIIS